MRAGELRAALATIPDDMPVCVSVRVGEDEQIDLEDGDALMGDVRVAGIEFGCGSAPPVFLLEADREPSDALDDEE